MDFFDFLLQSGLVTGALLLYLIFFRKTTTQKGNYRKKGWNHPLKVLCARYAVGRWKAYLQSQLHELPRLNQHEGWDSFGFRTTAPDGSVLILVIRKVCSRQPLAEIVVHVKLPDGTSYRLPQHPDTAVGAWIDNENGWSAKGLKFHISQEKSRYRILYNGLLTRVGDGVTQHVKLNLVWASASKPVLYPEEWSTELAAETLALEPWRDEEWSQMLGKIKEGSWLQWGTVQGRFESYDDEGGVDRSAYLRTRGVKERSWDPTGYEGLRRSFNVTASVTDGTAVQLRCLSYKNILTECISGCVRFPDYTVKTITSADLIMSDFCERPHVVPNVYTINVSTKQRDLKVVLRINADGGTLFSGVPYQHQIEYRTAVVEVNCVSGTGILELGYEPTVQSSPSVRLAPAPLLRWVSERDAGTVGYCLPFEDRAATCPAYVGGKGASLALLTSVQNEEGYRVPPGFCLTTRALDKYLELNPQVKDAIREIEAANEDYDEGSFKEKCKKASELFVTTAISGDVKDEILANMKDLRVKATEQKLGTELRFAVRSSAVGEDSEELSAAGQNETILGCVTDEHVLDGVVKCWASMFAFTSAYYRRQNGQACYCGGGVAVQALVKARAAGVLFSRHPSAGDPARLLLTANYGLGESVVSGAVEPDTITVKRGLDGSLTVSKIELGSKARRVKAEGSGIAMEDVPEAERGVACLTEAEALRLARIGASQEELWGAARDIEWAISGNDIYLLQARPITSLDRWTEEELLHELDAPIMADDELLSFGNTGEVLPKPISAMTYDFVNTTLANSMDKTIGTNGSGYDHCILLTHNRCALSLYNSAYRKFPEKVDIGIIMVEMAIHGHRVADDNIVATAKNRRAPRWSDKLVGIFFMLKCIFLSKWNVSDSINATKEMNFDTKAFDDPCTALEAIQQTEDTMTRLCHNHSITSSASTGSQFVAMSVLLEGKEDFTPEQCNEISNLFSSGDVLSAEVPVALANLARKLDASGRADEFRLLHPKDCLQWLKDNIEDLYRDVRHFLDEHGHRAIMEFDLCTKPWVLVPEEMMKVLQSLQVSNEESKKSKSSEDIIAALRTPQKTSTRKALRWILPLCHRTVRHREITKAHLILGIHKLRVAFLQLGRLLVRNWYLPNQELVFFFRHHELKDYIATRNPVLLKKASQRQQYYAGWCKLKFAEINSGWVEPLQYKGPAVRGGAARAAGTSVCGGEALGRACVVKDLSEIGELQKGDILITHATDIGWSPYFPLLSGIATELGGLISHGAVIAREYGLPCVVGASFATDVFRTGDLVRLSGTKGIIEKVEMEAETTDSLEV